MEEITKEIIPALQLLLPGFLTTIVFYWFASVPKPSQFERVLQALICTPLIKMSVDLLENLSYKIGEIKSFGTWTSSTTTAYSLTIPIIVGLGLAIICNHDIAYKIARKFRITKRASIDDTTHIFSSRENDVVIFHFIDGLRLLGYVRSFPSDCTAGVFLIDKPHWIDKSTATRYSGVESILINATDIQRIEFLE